MKRACAVLLVAGVVLAAGPGVPSYAQDGTRMLEGLNAQRQAGGLSPLRWDPTLGETAAAYAKVLAARGLLSHRDSSGRSALDRYHERGGTAVLVGEVLGSGPSAAAVLAAWGRSLSHRETLLDVRWTHAGAGRALLDGGAELWVAMFSRLLVEGLQVRPCPDGLCLEGYLAPAAAGIPVLLSGTQALRPELWQPAERRFRFLVPASRGGLYHRLGYADPDGRLRITDVLFPAALLTSAPGTAPR